jgi:hypothetical protein
LNTEEFDTSGFGSLAANQVTLQPGIYIVSGRSCTSASGVGALGGKARLRNITAGTTALVGETWFSQSVAGTGIPTYSNVCGLLNLTSATVFELQVYTAAVLVGGLGAAMTSGEVEVYAVLEFWRLGA